MGTTIKMQQVITFIISFYLYIKNANIIYIAQFKLNLFLFVGSYLFIELMKKNKQLARRIISKSPCTHLQTVLKDDPKMSDLLNDVLDNCMKKLHTSDMEEVGNDDFTASKVDIESSHVESHVVLQTYCNDCSVHNVHNDAIKSRTE